MKNKKKYTNGGPILPLTVPVESLSMKSTPIQNFNTSNMRMDGATMLDDFNARNPLDLTTPYTRAAITENYNPKTKSVIPIIREKKLGGLTQSQNNLVEQLQELLNIKTSDVFPKKYSTGGKILSTLASFVPGIGSILSPTIGMIDQTMDQNKLEDQLNYEQNKPQPMETNTRIYGNTMEKGGKLMTKNFKQYSTGSHASGNDMNININGIPTDNNVTASVQGKENAYTTKLGETYVYSNVLTNTETGNKFNTDAAKLNKKFNKADLSVEDRNALEFGMKRLSILNDKVRSIKEQVEMACGGKVKQMVYGGGPDDPVIPPSENIMWDAKLSDLYLDTELSIPLTDNMMYSQPMGEMIDNSTMNTSNLPISPITSVRSQTASSLPDINSLVKPIKPVQARTNSTLGDTNYNIPAMVLKGIGLAKSAADALTPAEVEKTILPDYRKSDKQMYATNIDYTQAKQDALAASNLAGNVNRSASGSFEQYQGRQANNFANYSDAVSRVSMKEALDRNQQYVQRAGYEQGKAVDKTNRLTQNKINNQMNAANANLADQKFFSELTNIGSEMNQYEETKKEIANNKELQTFYVNQGLALINSKYANFNLAPDLLERLQSNTYTIDDIVKIKVAVDKKDNK